MLGVPDFSIETDGHGNPEMFWASWFPNETHFEELAGTVSISIAAWKPKHPRIFKMVVSIGWWTKSLHGKLPGGFKYLLFSSRTLGKWSNLTNIFRMGWNHQLENGCFTHYPLKIGSFGFQVKICGEKYQICSHWQMEDCTNGSQWPVCRFVGLQSEAY